MELRRRKMNIRKLSVEIGNLSLEVERAKLEEKWGTKRPGDKKSPAEETLKLCKQLEEEPDELDSILQELCTHQSKVTSQVTDLRAQLAALTTG
ncbi:hypothetical protein BSL78_01619 [Apostichopus japonicus]|uniref:Uncharacterized protein n=2 Tax=Stichopus japonicus TaxID=307972 RepID=A0A2G8LMN6_STIJA|nr:hypothetical protein BSL78_01619 [Apostichopus japonicus]